MNEQIQITISNSDEAKDKGQKEADYIYEETQKIYNEKLKAKLEASEELLYKIVIIDIDTKEYWIAEDEFGFIELLKESPKRRIGFVKIGHELVDTFGLMV
jgi:hypothetical protein